MRVERSEDVRLILGIIETPGIREALFQGDEEAQVPIHPSIYYLVAREERFADGATEDCIVGVAAFHPVNSITWTPHLAILPEHRGKGAHVLHSAICWMYENTPCRKLFAAPPVFNVSMIRCFEKCGFFLEGRSPMSFMWHGDVYDRILMGREVLCGQE